MKKKYCNRFDCKEIAYEVKFLSCQEHCPKKCDSSRHPVYICKKHWEETEFNKPFLLF